MKREIDIFDNIKTIVNAMPGPGILVTTKAGDQVDAMTIGWGSVGIEWNVPIFTIYIRNSRFTYELLEKNPEFTICAPLDLSDSKVKKSLAICGSKSGRDVDKFEMAGLTKIDSDLVQSPAIQEFPLTVECKVVYKNLQEVSKIDSKFSKMYPESGTHSAPHVTFYGEILKSYIIE